MSENHDPETALQSSGNGAVGVETVLNVNVNVGELSSETAADATSENDSVLQSSEVSSGFSPSVPNQVSLAFIHMLTLQKCLNMNFPCRLEKKFKQCFEDKIVLNMVFRDQHCRQWLLLLKVQRTRDKMTLMVL